MRLGIVKYNAGNIDSVINAVRRLGVDPIVTDDAETLESVDGVIFPGQDEARSSMEYLREPGLDRVIVGLRQPVLGICIGQQLLCGHSEEGDTECMGIFPVAVKRFSPTFHNEKVPCMGWNRISPFVSAHRGMRDAGGLFAGIEEEAYVYFVHSYYVPICEWTIARTEYFVPYSAALRKGNFWTTQFHPEKSGLVGERILMNFLENIKG